MIGAAVVWSPTVTHPLLARSTTGSRLLRPDCAEHPFFDSGFPDRGTYASPTPGRRPSAKRGSELA